MTLKAVLNLNTAEFGAEAGPSKSAPQHWFEFDLILKCDSDWLAQNKRQINHIQKKRGTGANSVKRKTSMS